jgi:hypothetical protein
VHVRFQLDVDVENAGPEPLDLPSSPMPFVELRDGAGTLVTGWPSGAHAGSLASAPPGRATVTLAVSDDAVAGTRILTMTEATVRLRERPWPDAPFAEPIPVTISEVTP